MMTFWEKWYWANYIKGTNPFTTFVRGLLMGLWIPFLLSIVFCLFTDPQWAHNESLYQWSPTGFIHYWLYFWHGVWISLSHYSKLYFEYFVNHIGSIGRWFRHLLWLDHPEYFDGVGKD